MILVVLGFAGLTAQAEEAKLSNGSANGNLIPEPALRDYSKGQRTPGFSPIYAVVDLSGKPVSK